MISIVAANRPIVLTQGISLASTDPVVRDTDCEQWEKFDGELIVRNVQEPELYIFYPPKNVVSRKEAVLIVPGGAMMLLALQHEGIEVAEYLAKEGYTAFVLKYRVNPTPKETSEFERVCEDFSSHIFESGFGNFQSRLDTRMGVDDAIKAVDYIKDNCKHYGIDEGKVHYIGFSAGAILGQELISTANEKSKPCTLACIYGDMRKIELNENIPPPLFLVISNDDPFFSRQGFEIISQWQGLDQNVEFHLFEKGGHGFGMTQKNSTSDSWIQLYTAWIKNQALQ